MSQAPDIDDWLRGRLSHGGEHIESISEAFTGARANRYLIETNRRRLVLKRFPRVDEFARRECSSYALLTQRAPEVIPPVVAVDELSRCILLEHIDGDDLFGALATSDPLDVMRRLGGSIAQLLFTTRHDVQSAATAVEERRLLRTNIAKLAAILSAAGLPLSASVIDAMRDMAAAAEDAPLTLTQGDPAPSNVLFTSGHVRFIDFEYGATRHGLFDLAQWHMRCPLQEDWFDHLASTVRARVVGNGGFATNMHFDSQLKRMCQHAGIYMLTWLPLSAALQADRPWVGSWTVRRALLSTLDRLVSITDPPDLLHAAFKDLAKSLRRQWSAVGDCRIDWNALIQSSRA